MNKSPCINERIAKQAKPKSEAELIKVLKHLYLVNNKTENTLLRLHIDAELETVTWSKVKTFINW